MNLCRNCGGKMKPVGKTTMERTNIREYKCEKCGFIEERKENSPQYYKYEGNIEQV